MEKIKLLLYCTKQKPYLYREDDDTFKLENKQLNEDIIEYKKYYGLNNGKIVAECDFSIEALERIGNYIRFAGVEDGEWLNDRYYEYYSCLSEEELFNYIKDKFYAIHIKNLNIFDKPRDLDDYVKDNGFTIEKAPQNMMYAYSWDYPIKVGNCYKREKYILISIRPEWLCKILNGEKTIEVRKKVLKEMIK